MQQQNSNNSGASSSGNAKRPAPPSFPPGRIKPDYERKAPKISAKDGFSRKQKRKVPDKIINPNQSAKSFLESSTVAAPPSIAELARALKNDVDLIYDWVYSNVDFYLMWGVHKGAIGTLIDRVGAPFEQATLMVTLLREAGYTANYVAGTIRLTKDQLENLLGTDDSTTPTVTETFISLAQIPYDAVYDAGVLDYIDLAHVWVKVNIGGTDYVFDPSIKTYNYTSGVDLSSIIDYNETDLIDDAEDGATVGSDYVQDLNRANINNRFKGYGTDLLDWIRANAFDASLADIIGGREIEPLSGTPVRQTSLPYQAPGAPTDDWTEIPDDYRAIYQVRYEGINSAFYTDDLYSNRLTITFNGSDEPELRFNGSAPLDTGNAVTPDAIYDATFNVYHPLGFDPVLDSEWTQQLYAPGTYFLAMHFAPVSSSMVDYHQKALQQNIFNGGASGDEDVLGESLAILYFLHAFQSSRAFDICHWVGTAARFTFHDGGVTGYSTFTQPYIDLGDAQKTTISREGDTTTGRKVSSACALLANGFEAAIMQQRFPVRGVATPSVMDQAISDGQKIFDATSSTWMSSVRSQLVNWTSHLSKFDDLIAAGDRLIIHEDGLTAVDDWTGGGWHECQTGSAGTGIGGIISGQYLGGQPSSPISAVPNNGPESFKLWDQPKTADPVGLFSGDAYYNRNDITIGSGSFPYSLSFVRSYNSANRLVDGPLGLGWTHNLAVTASLTSNGARGLGELSPKDASAAISSAYVLIQLGLNNGSSPTLTKLLIGSVSTLWLMNQLTNNSVVISGNGETKAFIKMVDESFNPSVGDASILTQNEDETYTVKTPQQVEWNFNTEGNLETYVDPSGVTVTYEYDGSDRVIGISNGMQRALTLTYTSGRLTSVSDGNGRSVSYEVDGSSNLTTFTDAREKELVYEYDSPGLLARIFLPANPTIAIVENTYDSLGRVMTQTGADLGTWNYFFAGSRSEEVDPDGNSHITYWTRLGSKIREINALGEITRFELDGLNRVVRVIYPELNSRELVYDENNNVLSQTWNAKPGDPIDSIVNEFTYDEIWNKVNTATDGRGNTTTLNYDEDTGTLLSIVRPELDEENPTRQFTWNARGQLETDTDETGIVTKFNYDTETEVLLSVVRDFGSSPHLNLTMSFDYNDFGDVVSITDPKGNATTFSFDESRRMTQRVEASPFGFITNFGFDDNNRPTSIERQTGDPSHPWQTFAMTYSATGNLETVTNPSNDVTSYEYDDHGRIIGVTDALNHITQYTYDELSRIKTVVDAASIVSERRAYTANGKLASLEDARENTTLYEYDRFDRLEKTIYADSTYEFRTYDENSNMLTFRNRAGQITDATYDVLNRVATRETSGLPIQTLTYDLAGRLLKVNTPIVAGDPTSGDFEFSFDTAGRLVEQRMPNGKEVTYTLDENGKRNRLTYPDGYFVDYIFDELNRLCDIKLNGSMASAAHFEYDDLSNRTELSLLNGCTVQYTYESDNDVSSVVHSFVGSSVEFTYSFDEVHHMKDQQVSDRRFIWTPSLNLLTDYGEVNELNQYPVVGGSALSYDENGCLTGGGTWTYEYDALNHLTAASGSGGSVSFAYDPLDRLAEKTVGSEKTWYLYDGAQRIAEYDSTTGDLLNRFIYGVGLDEAIIQVSSDETLSFLHQERQGSVVAVTDATGDILERRSYGPFGETSTTGITPFGYTGQCFDMQSGLYYYKSRFYSPNLGRFLQPDAMGYDDGLHLYTYVKNNPVNFVDPLGLLAELADSQSEPWGLSSGGGSVHGWGGPIVTNGAGVNVWNEEEHEFDLYLFDQSMSGTQYLSYYSALVFGPGLEYLAQPAGAVTGDALAAGIGGGLGQLAPKALAQFGTSLALRNGLRSQSGVVNPARMAAGRLFESQVRRARGIPRTNTLVRAVGTVTTRPDFIWRNAVLIEIKDWIVLRTTSQIRAQFAVAQAENIPYHIIISPNTKVISAGVKKLLTSSPVSPHPVRIYRFDPASGSFAIVWGTY